MSGAIAASTRSLFRAGIRAQPMLGSEQDSQGRSPCAGRRGVSPRKTLLFLFLSSVLLRSTKRYAAYARALREPQESGATTTSRRSLLRAGTPEPQLLRGSRGVFRAGSQGTQPMTRSRYAMPSRCSGGAAHARGARGVSPRKTLLFLFSLSCCFAARSGTQHLTQTPGDNP